MSIFDGDLREEWDYDGPLCVCGHTFEEHVPLYGHPDGVEECQAEGCDCGKWRSRRLVGVTPVADETWNTCPDCGKRWRDEVPTPGLIHRTRLCSSCQPDPDSEKESKP